MPATEKDMALPDYWKHAFKAREIVETALSAATGEKRTAEGFTPIDPKHDARRARVIEDLTVLLARAANDSQQQRS